MNFDIFLLIIFDKWCVCSQNVFFKKNYFVYFLKQYRCTYIKYIPCHIQMGRYIFFFYIKQGGTLLKKIAWKHLRNNYQTLKVLPLVRSTEEVMVL